MSASAPLVLIGCGYTLRRLAHKVASAREVLASTRDEGAAAALREAGVEVVADAVALAQRSSGAEVVVSVPPDAGLDDALIAALRAARPRKVVYLSSTGVYGRASGEVDEEVPADPGGPGAARIAAEEGFTSVDAVILRIAGIYGPGRSLADRLRTGTFRLPEGAGRISRIHVDDLNEAILVALDRAAPRAILNVADDLPARLGEVVAYLCERLHLPPPPTIPLDQAPITLRGDRAISNARLRALGWRPRYPSYRHGFDAMIFLQAPP